MNSPTATALGKLFLCGEYSVLLGHSALVMTINRLAVSTYSATSAMEFWSRTGGDPVRVHDHWLFTATINACRRAGFMEKPGKYVVDTADFFDQKTKIKLGLGSSAAAIVSLCKLITSQTKPLASAELFLIAKDANLEFSHGLSSCADIAALCFGHAIHFQKSTTSLEHVQTLDLGWLWPNLIFIHTQQAQDTRDQVAHFLAFAWRNPQGVKPFLKHSDDICHAFMGQPLTLARQIEIVDEANALLLNLGQQAGLNIASEPHQQISKLAKRFGGSAKPSGAGGGDVSIAIVEEQHRPQFAKEILQNGFGILNLKPNQNT